MQPLVSRPSSEIDDVVVINFIGGDSGGRQQIMTSTNEDISLSLLYLHPALTPRYFVGQKVFFVAVNRVCRKNR